MASLWPLSRPQSEMAEKASQDDQPLVREFRSIMESKCFKRGCIQKSLWGYLPVYYRINGLKSKNRKFLEIAKSEDSENTTHVDFGHFLAILDHAGQKSQ